MATVTVPPYLNLQEDIRGLHQAFKGLGCDEKRVIQILGHRTRAQRLAVAEAYYTQYGESLFNRLKSELHNSLERAMLLWMRDPAERDATLLNQSMMGLGTKDTALIGIVCSRTPSQLFAIKNAYHAIYHRTLEHHIEGDTSGNYRKARFLSLTKYLSFIGHGGLANLLVALVRGNRSESPAVDPRLALSDAHELYRAGEGRWGTDEDAFIYILSTRSASQLIATLQYYLQTYGHDFEKAIKKETSGRLEDALLATVQCICYPARFFAMELYKSMKGLGTDDEALIRVVTTRAEVDMYYIKQEFATMYKKTLEHMIAGDTSGNYRYFLLTLVGGA